MEEISKSLHLEKILMKLLSKTELVKQTGVRCEDDSLFSITFTHKCVSVYVRVV